MARCIGESIRDSPGSGGRRTRPARLDRALRPSRDLFGRALLTLSALPGSERSAKRPCSVQARVMSKSTSLEADERSEEGYRSSQNADNEDSFLNRALSRAKGSSCPKCQGFFVVSAATGNAFEMSCKSWQCSHCSIQRRAVAVELISGGVLRARHKKDRVRFMTLTSPPAGMTLPELYASWNRLRATLRASGELREYCAVVELGSESRPAPHLHVLATGTFIPQDRLCELAERAQFGPITDIRAVNEERDSGAAAYVTKQLAGDLVSYLAKSEARRLAEAPGDGTAKRSQIRPVRISRSWYPGGFKAAEEVVKRELAERMGRENEARDPGPWYMVAKRWDGGLSVIARPGKQGDQADEHEASASGAPGEDELITLPSMETGGDQTA